MLYLAIGVGLGVLALSALALLRRPRANERGDHVAPSVLTRINAEYHEHRH
jgi:hypothetical protein